MAKACLVDWIEGDLIVPWMIFSSIEEAITIRKGSHSSWPNNVCEIEDEPCKSVFTRRAQLSGKRDPYRNEKTGAYRALSPVKSYYD